MSLELLSKTNDRVFKEIFTRNKSSMADFLKCILNISNEEFEDLEFIDTHSRRGSILGDEYIFRYKSENKILYGRCRNASEKVTSDDSTYCFVFS